MGLPSKVAVIDARPHGDTHISTGMASGRQRGSTSNRSRSSATDLKRFEEKVDFTLLSALLRDGDLTDFVCERIKPGEHILSHNRCLEICVLFLYDLLAIGHYVTRLDNIMQNAVHHETGLQSPILEVARDIISSLDR